MKVSNASVVIMFLAATAGAAAQEASIMEYDVFLLATTPANGILANTTVTVQRPHNQTTQALGSVVQVVATYTVGASTTQTPTAEFRLLWDGAAVSDCNWRVTGQMSTGGTYTTTLVIPCKLMEFANGTHHIEIERTSVTGTPVTSSHITILIHQQENTSMTNDVQIMTFMDVFLPVILWLIYVFISFKFAEGPIRLLAMGVGLLILLLPMHPLVFWVIGLAHTASLGYAAFTQMEAGQ
jgi:hypothetical protein